MEVSCFMPGSVGVVVVAELGRVSCNVPGSIGGWLQLVLCF